MIDTHSHIYSEEFDLDRDEVISRARQVGLTHILLPAIDVDSYDRLETLALSDTSMFRQMMGLHPTSVNNEYFSQLLVAKEKLFSNPDKYIGIGEIGLDFYWDTTYREQQTEALIVQLSWAMKLNKPVVLHLRNDKDGSEENNAYSAIFNILEKNHIQGLKGIFHCFSGSLDDARRAVAMGFVIGIGGVVTYKKSILPDIVSTLPLDKIVLETDAPYLAPVPHRGHRNECAFIINVAQKVAEIKNISLEKVDEVTSATAKNVFGL